jgi:hypothetical protein
MKSKITSAVMGLAMVLTSAGALTITSAPIAQARDMADCDGLQGRDWYNCKANRARAEKEDQLSGNQDDGRRRKAGPGRVYRKCKDAEQRYENAATFSVDSATSEADCR